MHTFPTGLSDTFNSRFNRRGTRLLGVEANQLPVVYDVPTWQQMSATGAASRKIQLYSPGYSYGNGYGRNSACFVGKEDELVVAAASTDNGLYVWSLPVDQQPTVYDQYINQPLGILRGHEGYISAVRYNHNNGILASSGKKTIKLWTTS